jgi:hypothetical protein
MSEPEGGLGGRSGRGIRDTRLVERALRERWPITKALRRPVVERLGKIVQDPKASPREAVAAARALLGASRINLERLGVVARVGEIEEIAALLGELEKKVDELEQDQITPGQPRNPARNGRA